MANLDTGKWSKKLGHFASGVYINNGTIRELNFLETILVYDVMDLQGFSMGFFMFNLPDTNSEFTPENGWLEDYLPFRMAYFQSELLVLGRVMLGGTIWDIEIHTSYLNFMNFRTSIFGMSVSFWAIYWAARVE